MGRLEKLLQDVKTPPVLTPKQVRVRSIIFFVLAFLVWGLGDQIARSTGDLYVVLPVLAVTFVILGFYCLITGKLPNKKR